MSDRNDDMNSNERHVIAAMDNEGETCEVVVRTLEFGSHEITLPRTATLRVLKGALAEITGVEAERQRLLHRGREVEGADATLESLNWGSGVVLHMVTQSAPQGERGAGPQQQQQQMNQPFNPQLIQQQLHQQAMQLMQQQGQQQQQQQGQQQQQQQGQQQQQQQGQQQQQQQGQQQQQQGQQPGGMPFLPEFLRNIMANAGMQGGVIGPISINQDGMMQSPDEILNLFSSNNEMDSTIAEPIPGTLLSGRAPPLDRDGNLAMGSSFDAMHTMIRRLEDQNMENDEVPSMQQTSMENIRDGRNTRAWALAIREFLRSCRTILLECRLNRETLEVVNRALRAGGLSSLRLGVRSFPVINQSIDDSDDDIPHIETGEEWRPVPEAPEGRSMGGQQIDTANDSEYLANLNQNDVIVTAAVAIGELARRFLGVIGQAESPVGSNALVLRLAERLRSLSAVTNLEETVQQIQLVAGYLCRLAVSSAELGRSMAYLASALQDANMFLLQLYPGYIRTENGLPRPNLGILHNIEAHRVMTAVPNIPGMPEMPNSTQGISGVISMMVPVPNQSDMGQPRPDGTGAGQGDNIRQQQPMPGAYFGPPQAMMQQFAAQMGIPRPQPNPQPGQPQTRIAATIISSSPMMGQPGAPMRPPVPPPGQQQRPSVPPPGQQQRPSVPPPGQQQRPSVPPPGQQQRPLVPSSQPNTGTFNILGDMPNFSVDVSAIMNDVRTAISLGLQEASSQLNDTQSRSIEGLVSAAVPQLVSRIQQVLTRHFLTMFRDAFGLNGELPPITAVPVPGAGTNANSTQQQATATAQQQATATASTASAQQPIGSPEEQGPIPMQGVVEQEARINEEPPQREHADVAEKRKSDTEPQATQAHPDQPSSSSGPKCAPMGLGLGLRGKPKRAKSAAKPKETVPPVRTSAAAPRLPPRPGASAPPSISSRGSGGLMNQLLQSNSMRDMMSSPAFQQAAGQMMGSMGAGDGLDIGSLLNSAGPLLSQMMGGSNRRQERPLDVDTVLDEEIQDDSRKEALRKKFEELDATNVSQEGLETERPPLSEAYLACIPAKPASGGLLDTILGDE